MVKKKNAIYALLHLNLSYLMVKLVCFLSIEHSGVVTGVKFGKHASFIASVGLDRHLKFYSR